jgi:hypothetical protein
VLALLKVHVIPSLICWQEKASVPPFPKSKGDEQRYQQITLHCPFKKNRILYFDYSHQSKITKQRHDDRSYFITCIGYKLHLKFIIQPNDKSFPCVAYILVQKIIYIWAWEFYKDKQQRKWEIELKFVKNACIDPCMIWINLIKEACKLISCWLKLRLFYTFFALIKLVILYLKNLFMVTY